MDGGPLGIGWSFHCCPITIKLPPVGRLFLPPSPSGPRREWKMTPDCRFRASIQQVCSVVPYYVHTKATGGHGFLYFFPLRLVVTRESCPPGRSYWIFWILYIPPTCKCLLDMYVSTQLAWLAWAIAAHAHIMCVHVWRAM